jgi:tetratricopeptide (TPR) repeat protein
MTFLAGYYAELDRFAEARTLFEEALGLYRRVFGEESMLTANAMNLYAGDILLGTGPEERWKENAEEALGLAERACALAEKGPGPNFDFLDTLALAQHLTGDTEKAIETQKRALVLMPEESGIGNMKGAWLPTTAAWGVDDAAASPVSVWKSCVASSSAGANPEGLNATPGTC